jgi:hypothetical protein
MFQNAAIDVAIALALMYLLLSLACTVINEYIATKLNLRSKSLEVALQAILDDPGLRRAFYAHGLVAGTKNAVAKAADLMPQSDPLAQIPPPAAAPAPTVPPGPPAQPVAAAPPAPPAAPAPLSTHPSYVSTETFVLALVGSLSAGRLAQGGPIPVFADVQTAIQNLPPSKIKDTLVTNLTVAEGDFQRFRTSVATWFDDSMDRLTGAYKRNLKFISIVVGCVVAVILNADTFEVGRKLWSDGALRAQMVQVADATLKNNAAQKPPVPGADKAYEDVTKSLQVANENLRPLPIGWSRKKADDLTLSSWLLKIVGLFVTALALSLGAPFWFDTLSQFMNIRATGVKPERQT